MLARCAACRLEQLELTSQECAQLMPQSMAEAEARVAALEEELARVENDILEAEAKNELYKLLEVRTRWVSLGRPARRLGSAWALPHLLRLRTCYGQRAGLQLVQSAGLPSKALSCFALRLPVARTAGATTRPRSSSSAPRGGSRRTRATTSPR